MNASFSYFVKNCKYYLWVIFMKRRNIVRLVSFLSAIIVALGGVIISDFSENERLRLEIENNYSRNLNELTASMNNISLLLKKARYTTSAASLSQMAAELLTEAEISKNALSQLPAGSRLNTLNRFLSQTGNYAFAVSAKLYADGKMPEDYLKNITALSETAEKVLKIVSTAQVNFDNSDYWIKEVEEKIEEGMDESLTSALEEIEGQLSDYPTLIYDGPYSDHISNKAPQMLKNENSVSENTAKQKAADFLGVSTSNLEFAADEKGKIETFRFGNKSVDISVSKLGGYIVYMRKNRVIEKHIIDYKHALEKAKKFLSDRGMSNLVETYYFTDEGVCVVNFAYRDGQTICYTDLIKVGIAMDNGEVMLYEASGYLSNHQTRAFESAVYTAEQASKKISKGLKIEKTKLALIPTKRGTQERCYEFLCRDSDTEVLVYINVLTCEQEEILILLKNDGGTLAK